MDQNNLVTIARNSFYIIEIDQQNNRAYLTLTEYWKRSVDLADYIKDVQEGLSKMCNNFTILLDLTHYNGTSPELQHLHIDAQRMALSNGLSRIAEVFSSNPIIKLFFEAYSKESGANAMAFSNKEHAERWLDLYK